MMTGDAPDASDGHDTQPLQYVQREGELSQILATISHEIKNPLASLKLNAQMLTRAIQRGQMPHIESARLLAQAVDQLDQIASELSEAGRAEGDRLPLTLRLVDLASLAQRCAAEAEALYQRPIALELSGAPLLAQADEGRIRQVIAYLLANAVRYTPAQGGITLAARPADGRILVEARDQGSGISEHDLPYIFDPFYRGSTPGRPAADTGAQLGLGLAIARRIIQRHGGNIGADSVPGYGATVWFTLPPATCN